MKAKLGEDIIARHNIHVTEKEGVPTISFDVFTEDEAGVMHKETRYGHHEYQIMSDYFG